MPYLSVRDIDVWFDRAGTGPALLAFSGSRGDLRRKPNLLESPLTKAFDVLAYDQRGLGRTSKPDKPYSMADYADDAAALMDAVGWPAANVVGVSFGGMVALEFVLRHRNRVTKLALCCTSPGGAGGSSYPLHTLQALPSDERARRMVSISDTRCNAAWAADNPVRMQELLKSSVDDPFADEPAHQTGITRVLEARREHDTWDRLNRIACPVLVCGGRYDGIALPASQQRMASRISGSTLRTFEGGHQFLWQDHSAFLEIVEFLREKGGPYAEKLESGPCERNMRAVLGIDAAWTQTEPSGIAVAVESSNGWRLVAAEPSYQRFHARSDSRLQPEERPSGSLPDPRALLISASALCGQPVDLVAADMPLARSPIVGRRVSDDAVSRAYGARKCGTHSPNALRPGRISALLRDGFEREGYFLLTDAITAPGLIEVYPHPALVELAGSNCRLPYKASKTRSYWPSASPSERRAHLFGKWNEIAGLLEAQIAGSIAALPKLETSSRNLELKAYEDTLDAIVCAWVAVCALDGRAVPFGDENSSIWIPLASHNG